MTGKVFVWCRPRVVDGRTDWQPRIMHPFVVITNGIGVMRLTDVELGDIRTCDDDRWWDYNPTSDIFRGRVEALLLRVKDGHAAFAPDPRIRVQHWRTLADYRNEGPFETRWVHLRTLDDKWDITLTDERVGATVYENRPFQHTHR